MKTIPISKHIAAAIATLSIVTIAGTGGAAANLTTPANSTVITPLKASADPADVIPAKLLQYAGRSANDGRGSYSSSGNCMRVRYRQAKDCMENANRYHGYQRIHERRMCRLQWQRARDNCYRR
jgi:hypothetical protein